MTLNWALIKFWAILSICIAYSSEVWADRFIPAKQKLTQSLVKVTLHFDTAGCISQQVGFALVIGETESVLSLALPNHVLVQPPVVNSDLTVRHECLPNELSLNFFANGVGETKIVNPLEYAVYQRKQEEEPDLAILLVPRPKPWNRWHMPNISTTTSDVVGFLGYIEQAVLSPTRGKIVTNCDRRGSGGCKLYIEGLASDFGNSGAPVIDEEGIILGVILGSSRPSNSTALPIDLIKQFAESVDAPWNLFSIAEETVLGSRLNNAISTNQNEEIQSLLQMRFNLDKDYEREGSSDAPPILTAAIAKKTNLVSQMIDLGARDTAAAVRVSIQHGDTSVISQAIRAGRDISCSLIRALVYDNHAAVQEIVTSDFELASNSKPTECLEDISPLYFSIDKGNTQLARKLISAGVDPDEGHHVQDFTQGLPLTLSILRESEGVTEALLSAGADPLLLEYRSDFSRFGIEIFGPLHAAAYVGDLQLVKSLIGAGVNPDVHSIERHGRTIIDASPIEAALLNGQVHIAEYLYRQHNVALLGYRGRYRLVTDYLAKSKMDSDRLAAVLAFIDKEKPSFCEKVRNLPLRSFADQHWAEVPCD